MKKRLVSIMMVMMLLCATFATSASDVQAVSKGKKAKAAYAEVLSDKSVAEGIISASWGLGADTKFALIDINQDGIPELLFTPDDGYHLDIVSFVNGKAKCVGSGFSGDEKYYPGKHIYYSRTTHEGNDSYTYCNFTGRKMKVIAEKYGNIFYNVVTGKMKPASQQGKSFAPYVYRVNGKKVSAKKYKTYVNKLLSGVKSVKPKWHKNTAANRKKYL